MSSFKWNEPLIIANASDHHPEIKSLLIDGEVSILVIRKALPATLLADLTSQIINSQSHITTSNYINGALTTFGPYLARHLSYPHEYFEKYNAIKPYLPAAAIQIVKFAYEKICSALSLDSIQVAMFSDDQTYSPYVLRIHANGVSNPLHNDMIMRDAKGSNLCVEYLASQLSCVICIQECNEGGALKLYDKYWHIDDEKYKIRDGLGYHMDVVDGHAVCSFKPEKGDIYIFNPTHYHEIDRVQGNDRITLGFFFGFKDKHTRKAIAWS